MSESDTTTQGMNREWREVMKTKTTRRIYVYVKIVPTPDVRV